MQTDLKEAESFFAELYDGKHHIPSPIHPFGQGWTVNHFGDLSTFDFNTLTRLVFLAHDRCMRASIMQSGPRMVKIAIWKRTREGSIYDRHPTIEAALEQWRKNNK